MILLPVRCDYHIPFIQARTVATELALQEVLFRAQDPCLPLERRDSLGGQLVMQCQIHWVHLRLLVFPFMS